MIRTPKSLITLVVGVAVTGFMLSLAAHFADYSTLNGRIGVAAIASFLGAVAVGVAVLATFEFSDGSRRARMRWNRRQRIAKAQIAFKRAKNKTRDERTPPRSGEGAGD